MATIADDVSFDTFQSVELRTGTVVKAEPFPEARKPAIKVWVDFGDDIGVKQSSAQITVHYTPETIVGKQVVGCINLGSMRIAGFKPEFLLTGFTADDGSIILVSPDQDVPNGAKLC